MQQWAFFAEGLNDLDLDELDPKKVSRAMSMAINRTAKRGRTQAARLIREQINLPARYVAPNSKGVSIPSHASPTNLSATIRASGRPTSLARYAQGSPKMGKSGAVVEVQPGRARFMKRAFFMRLPQGSTLTDTKYNLGLAIRLRPGESLSNKLNARRVQNGLYLLYGPSVDQVFEANDGDGVAKDITPDLEKALQNEFLRLMEL